MATKTQTPRTFGERVSTLRQKMQISQRELATRVGLKQPSLWEIEQGHSQGCLSGTLIKLADALDTDPRYLQTGIATAQIKGALSVTETQLIARFRSLNPQGRTIVGNAVMALCLTHSRPAGKPKK